MSRDRWRDVAPPLDLALPSQSTYAIFNLYALSISMFALRSTIGSLGGTCVTALMFVCICDGTHGRPQFGWAADGAGAA